MGAARRFKMFAGGSPRISSGPAGGGNGNALKSNVNQSWQSSLRGAGGSASRASEASASRAAKSPRASRTGSASRSRASKSQEPSKAALQPVEDTEQFPYPFGPPGSFEGMYDPYAGPHPAGYGAAVPVEYDSFFAPHYTEQYPNGDFLYDRPVMYNDLPAYMPSYKDLLDRKERKQASLGREVLETQGTRKEVASSMIPPKRVATSGYRPAVNRGAQPAYNSGAGWYGEKSAQDVANSHAHSNTYHIPDRFERSKHRMDWKDWTREESDRRTYRVRRHGDSQFGDDHLYEGHHASKSPPGVKHVGRTSSHTIQQPRAHGNVYSSQKPLMTL